MKLKWLRSIETLKFDTPDGDLHKNQFAIYKGCHFVRIKSEVETQFECLEARDDAATLDIPGIIAGMTQVNVLDNEKMYYDIFELPDGTQYRVPSNKIAYDDLAKVNAGPKQKDITDVDIQNIKSEKQKWQ